MRALLLSSIALLAAGIALAPAKADLLSGLFAYGQKDYARAIVEFSADDTIIYPQAKLHLARLYQFGKGTAPDPQKAVAYLEAAIEQGSLEAAYVLAETYEFALAVPKDLDRAVELYRQAADGGFAPALVKLGYLSYAGKGLPKDMESARAYYEKAAALGDPAGQTNLGFLYEHGDGVAIDLVKAEALYRQAAKADHPMALNNLAWLLAGQQGALDEARQLATRAVQLSPSPAFFDTLGQVAQLQGDSAAAEKAFQAALQLAPRSEAAHERLGDFYWQAGRLDDARRIWQEALELRLSDDQRQRLEAKLRQRL